MFLLRRNCKIGILFLFIAVSLTLTFCSLRGKENNHIIENTSESNKLSMNAMLQYNTEASSDLPTQITDNLPQDAAVTFYSTEQNIPVLFYVEDSNEPAVIWINGEKYPFSYGLGYSPMESEAPFFSICDINNDAEADILICGTSYRTELRQDVYLSNGTGGYIELGDVTWNKNETQHSFTFHATCRDAYQIQITSPDWNIDETKKVEEALAGQLVLLGVYDGEGNVTEYGQNWEMSQLQGKSVTYIHDEAGNTYLCYETQIEAGYSEYTLGYGFRFEYLIADGMYELKNVEFIDEVES